MKRSWSILFASALVLALGGCSTTPTTTTGSGPLPVGGGYTVCCHDFPEVLTERVYPVLIRNPGVHNLKRISSDSRSLCYRMDFDGRPEELEAWLASELRTSTVKPFRVVRGNNGHGIDLIFDAGFE